MMLYHVQSIRDWWFLGMLGVWFLNVLQSRLSLSPLSFSELMAMNVENLIGPLHSFIKNILQTN